jgi:hypothetical protein
MTAAGSAAATARQNKCFSQWQPNGGRGRAAAARQNMNNNNHEASTTTTTTTTTTDGTNCTI